MRIIRVKENISYYKVLDIRTLINRIGYTGIVHDLTRYELMNSLYLTGRPKLFNSVLHAGITRNSGNIVYVFGKTPKFLFYYGVAAKQKNNKKRNNDGKQQ